MRQRSDFIHSLAAGIHHKAMVRPDVTPAVQGLPARADKDAVHNGQGRWPTDPRLTPIPPIPGGVAMAAIVSSASMPALADPAVLAGV